MAGVRKDLTRSLYLYGTAVLVLFGALKFLFSERVLK